MTKQVVEQILGRMITDEKFRQLFFSNPEEALKDHDLAAEEREALLKTKKEDVEGFSRKLDDRITKAKLHL
jgi:putative modified peptide